jgi:lipopolysaccharide transport system permease protein
VLVQLWLFLTPVIYPASLVPAGWQWLLGLNPMTGLVGGFRAALLGQPMPWTAVAVSLLVGAAGFIVGVLYFRATERTFADVV